MPTYYFNLKGIQERYLDPYGTELADDAQAREHARQVALELMQGREGKTRSWRLEICDVTRSPIFELLFAKVDPTLTELPPNFRTTVEQACARTGALMDGDPQYLSRAQGHPLQEPTASPFWQRLMEVL